VSIHQSGVTLKCDTCRRTKVFVSSEDAAKWARSMGWQAAGKEHRCPACTQDRTENQKLNDSGKP